MLIKLLFQQEEYSHWVLSSTYHYRAAPATYNSRTRFYRVHSGPKLWVLHQWTAVGNVHSAVKALLKKFMFINHEKGVIYLIPCHVSNCVHVSIHCLYCACECTLPILCMWVYIAYTVHVSVHCLYCACECTLPILCMWVYIAYTVHVSVHCLYCACECTLPILCMWVYIAYTVHVSVHCLYCACVWPIAMVCSFMFLYCSRSWCSL